MPKPDKFGSSFDPKNRSLWESLSGKLRSFEEQQRMERETHRLRGCLDPGCNLCNPETAQSGAFSRPGLNLNPGSVNTVPTYNSGEDPSYPTIRSSRTGQRYTLNLDDLPYLGLPSSVFTDLMSSDSDIMLSHYDQGLQRRQGRAYRGIGLAPASVRTPPASYIEAREAVKKWLLVPPEQSFDDIIGNEEALALLRDAIEAPVKHKALYEAYSMKMPKGALLSGPPGCGKTMFARAAASTLRTLYGGDGEFICTSGSDMQSPFIGVTEGYISAIFAYAREYAAYHSRPLLVFMDEAEVFLPDRTGRVRRVSGWEESQVATFLAEMDGIRESGAFVLLATNRPEVIDQAILRDGRCDFKIVVKRPTPAAIEAILTKSFTGLLLGEDLETLVFAAMEVLYNPHKIIAEAHAIKLALENGAPEIADQFDKHFLLEHILSGAMTVSIPARALRHAFSRDKVSGAPLGITTENVVAACNDLFEENKGLEHSFAKAEFLEQFKTELQARYEKKGKTND